jgi:glycosyltransferase involved in cell wall biosynthesis
MVVELSNRGGDIIVISLNPYQPIQQPLDGSVMWKELEGKTIEISSETGGNKLKSLLAGIKLHSLTYARWLRVVLDRAIELQKKHHFDIIYSRSLPMIAHVAGYWISRKLNRPWIANINDPWDIHLFPDGSNIKMPLHLKIVSNFWLKKTLRSANLITYPTERLRNYHVKLTGIDHNAEIIPHIGYSKVYDLNSKSFRLTHTGKLGASNSTGRSPRALLKGLKAMLAEHDKLPNDIKLVLVGPRDIATESMIREIGIDNSMIEITGRVSYEESLRYIAQASVCILVEGNLSEGIFLPSKFVDYLAAGKPILAMSPKTGTVADFCNDKGIIRVDLDDSDQIKYALSRLYGLFKEDYLGSVSSNLSDRFSADVIANLFLQFANKLL